MNVPAVYTEAFMQKNGQLTLMKRCSAQGYIFPDMLKSPGPMFQGLLVRKECLLRVGLLDESLPAWQEWDAFLRLSQYYKFGSSPSPALSGMLTKTRPSPKINREIWPDTSGLWMPGKNRFCNMQARDRLKSICRPSPENGRR